MRQQTAINHIKEIIVVNYRSTDKSKIVVEKYKEKYKELPIILINKKMVVFFQHIMSE